MELKTKDGFELVDENTLKQHREVSEFIPVVRNAVSKAWRLMDKLEKLLTQPTQPTKKENTDV